MYLQSIKSVKHNAAKSVNRSILKQTFRVRCPYSSFVHGEGAINDSTKCTPITPALHVSFPIQPAIENPGKNKYIKRNHDIKCFCLLCFQEGGHHQIHIFAVSVLTGCRIDVCSPPPPPAWLSSLRYIYNYYLAIWRSFPLL